MGKNRQTDARTLPSALLELFSGVRVDLYPEDRTFVMQHWYSNKVVYMVYMCTCTLFPSSLGNTFLIIMYSNYLRADFQESGVGKK